MEYIIKYFKAALAAILAIFGITLDEEFSSNLESMFGGLKDFEPESEAGTIDM